MPRPFRAKAAAQDMPAVAPRATIPPVPMPPAQPQHIGTPTPRESRAHAAQRLQVGLFGLALMLLLVGVANIIMNHARLGDAGLAPGATAAGSARGAASAGPNSDPLADIGVIPSPDGAAARPAAAPPRRR